MSDKTTLKILTEFLDLSVATRHLFPIGDVLKLVAENRRALRFHSRMQNQVVEVPRDMLRSVYFRAYSEEITIESGT